MNKMTFAMLGMLSALTACQTAPEMIWLRTDGQSQAGNPHLAQQFQIDQTICQGEAQKAAVGAPLVWTNGSIGGNLAAAMVQDQQARAVGDVGKGCMAQRGYLLVPAENASFQAQLFRQNALEASQPKPLGTQ